MTGDYCTDSPQARPLCSCCLNDLAEQQAHSVLAIVTHTALRRGQEPAMTPIDPVSLFSPHLGISKG